MCTAPEGTEYFDHSLAKCTACPQAGSIAVPLVAVVLPSLAVMGIIALIYKRPPRCLQSVSTLLHRGVSLLLSLGLMPKFKVRLRVLSLSTATHQMSHPRRADRY